MSATFSRRSLLAGTAASAVALVATPTLSKAASLSEIRLDYATYNPLSLVIRARGLLEREFAADGTTVRWVQSLGSNKALEFLNAGSIDIGGTAGAAALIGRVNGNPIKAVGVYSRAEWTALVTAKGSSFASPADLKGRSIAVTRGTDPHIFLVRALETVGLTEHDVKLVLLQHPDGKTALIRGDVDAWAGLDPLMAQAEIENGAKLFYRNPSFNSAGFVNVRERFAAENPDAVRRVLKVYEAARTWAVANPDDLKAILIKETRLADAIVARQLERTDLSSTAIGVRERDATVASGAALQKASIIPVTTDVAAAVAALVDPSFATGAG